MTFKMDLFGKMGIKIDSPMINIDVEEIYK